MYTTQQQEIIETLKSAQIFFNGDDSVKYATLNGFNGYVISSLIKRNVIKKFNHKIYKGYYTLVIND